MAEPCLAIAENREDVYKYTAKTIGGSIAWNSSARSTIDFNRTSYTILPDSMLLFQGTISGTNRWANIVSSMYGERKLRNGEQVTMGMDYIYFKNNNPTEVGSTFLTETGNRTGQGSKKLNGLYRPFNFFDFLTSLNSRTR